MEFFFLFFFFFDNFLAFFSRFSFCFLLFCYYASVVALSARLFRIRFSTTTTTWLEVVFRRVTLVPAGFHPRVFLKHTIRRISSSHVTLDTALTLTDRMANGLSCYDRAPLSFPLYPFRKTDATSFFSHVARPFSLQYFKTILSHCDPVPTGNELAVDAPRWPSFKKITTIFVFRKKFRSFVVNTDVVPFKENKKRKKRRRMYII